MTVSPYNIGNEEELLSISRQIYALKQVEVTNKLKSLLNKRAKMAMYRSPDYQINWPFGSGEVQKKISNIVAVAVILDFWSEWS